MSDSVTKIIPYEPFEIECIETWLDELATKGLVLQEITYVFAKFKKAEPSRTRFRIDFSPITEQKFDSTRRSLIKEKGWQYVTVFSSRYRIYKTEDPFLTELPVGDATPKSSATWYNLSVSISIVIAVQCIFYLFAHLHGQFGILDSLLNDTLLGFHLFVFMALLLFCFVRFITFRTWKHRKGRSVVQSQNASVIGRQTVQVIVKIILPFVAIAMCLGLMLGSEGNGKPLQDFAGSIPFPLLEEINPAEGQDLSKRITSDEHEIIAPLDHYITKEHHVLSPLIIQTRQSGPWIQIGGGHYVSQYSYCVYYYQMLNRPLAKWYAAELSQNLGSKQIASTSEGFTAWYLKSEDDQSLIIEYQNIVIRVWYDGATDLRDCIPLYETYLGIKQET